MGSVIKSYSDLILVLTHDPLVEFPSSPTRGGASSSKKSPRPDAENTLTVAVGGYAAIKLTLRRHGDIHVRVIKHGRKEDLFPADFILERGGTIRVQQYRLSKRLSSEREKSRQKYDLEVHVDERCAHLLQNVDCSEHANSGRSSTTTLVPEDGETYQELRMGIFVKTESGELHEFTNQKVELNILDYEVVDENGTGVFEPGSFIRIQNIIVQNTGISYAIRPIDAATVPSPAIPLCLAPTRWIEPLEDGLRIKNIPGNKTVKLDGTLRAMIRQDVKRDFTANLFVQETVTVLAKLPDIAMDMQPISAQKTITIHYPIKIELLTPTKWLAPNTTTQLSWKITNISKKTISRPIATTLTILDHNNSIIFPNSPKLTRSVDQYTSLPSNSFIIITKKLQSAEIEKYAMPSLRFDLFLAEPQSDSTYFSTQPSLMPDLRCLCTIENPLVIASPLKFTNADILLVSNANTSSSTILEFKEFAHDLGLSIDVYNLGLYKTLYPRQRSILNLYRGGTIILMGNEFARGNFANGSVISLIDQNEITQLLQDGTSVTICDIEMTKERDVKRWMSNIIHGTNVSGEVTVDADGVVREIAEDKDVEIVIPLKNGPWEKQADKLLKTLTKSFPSRRFSLTRRGEAYLSIQQSLAPFTGRLKLILNSPSISLNRFAASSSLPFRLRLRLLWSSFSRNSAHLSQSELLALSVTHDILTDTTSTFLRTFLTYQSKCQFRSISIVLLVLILSGILSLKVKKKEIQKFLDGHYSPELHERVQLQLKSAKKLSLVEVETMICANSGIEMEDFNTRILDSRDITSEILTAPPVNELKDDGTAEFQEMFAQYVDELVEGIPMNVTHKSEATSVSGSTTTQSIRSFEISDFFSSTSITH